MNVIAHGPYRVASLVWQPSPGAWSLTIACRAGFELAPGESSPISLPKEAPDETRRLLEQAVVMAPHKRWPEVIVVGDAHAPEGKPVTSLTVRLAVGELDKVIQVTGDRHLTAEGALVGPAPFTRMPLGWDRAAGGPDTWNPAGVMMGAGAPPDGWGRVRLPNLEPAGASVTTRRDLVPPVGLGPIPPRWPTRVQRLHRHAASWDLATWSERPLPPDFDFTYFDVAPADQALPELTGKERLVLEHLHPRHPRLVTYLRSAPLRATAGLDGVSREVPLRCDTLIIDSDLGIAQLVWRGHIALDHPQRTGIVIVEPAAAAAAPANAAATMVLHDSAPAVTVAAPFMPPAAKAPLPFRESDGDEHVVMHPTPLLPRPPAPRRSDMVETIAPLTAPLRPAVPFIEPAPASPAPPPAPAPAPVPASPRFGAPPLAPPVMALEAAPPPPPPPLPEEPPPAPPPMIGPLATPEMVTADPSTGTKAAEPGIIDGPLPLDAYPIDRCARIAASLARRPSEEHAILEGEQLASARWEALHDHWLGELRAESGRGKKTLLQAYDAAYVTRLEEERGPIEVEGYAQLVLAHERGSGEARLAEMGLPPGAMMRLRRVWLARIVKDAQLARALRAATSAAAE